MLAWLLLLFLTAFAGLASFGVTVRADVRSRLDAGILVTLVFFALVSTPVLALGYTGHLRPLLVAPASIALFGASFFFSRGTRSLMEHTRESMRLARSLVSLPSEALDLALKERSFVVLGLAATVLLIAFSAWLTYVAPSESWDGFFYHEPMIGFAIQNQGFRFVDLPPSGVIQATNGYPRLCEAFALFFVLFTDKTFIEIGNTFAAPGLLFVTFALCRRYNPSPVPALGWSAVIFLMPAVVTQLRTSMIDVEVAFFLIAAVYYATHPSFAFRDALVASLAMALLAGAKSSAVVWVPQLALLTYGRLLLLHEGRVLRSLALTVGGALSLAGIGALTYLRNWQAFGNPNWPFRYTNPRLGLAWPGVTTLTSRGISDMRSHGWFFPSRVWDYSWR